MGRNGGGYGQYFADHGHDHGHPWAWLLVLLLLALAAAAGYLLARWRAGRAAPAVVVPAEDEAVALLRLRFARGEIDREQYLDASAALVGPT
jgi:putative membrane protein